MGVKKVFYVFIVLVSLLLLAFLLDAALSGPILCDGPDWDSIIVNITIALDGCAGTPLTSESNLECFGEPIYHTPGRRCPACLERGNTV